MDAIFLRDLFGCLCLGCSFLSILLPRAEGGGSRLKLSGWIESIILIWPPGPGTPAQPGVGESLPRWGCHAEMVPSLSSHYPSSRRVCLAFQGCWRPPGGRWCTERRGHFHRSPSPSSFPPSSFRWDSYQLCASTACSLNKRKLGHIIRTLFWSVGNIMGSSPSWLLHV